MKRDLEDGLTVLGVVAVVLWAITALSKSGIRAS